MKFKRLIGDKNFYKGVLSIAFPIMPQNGITNVVGMLDNIMVGRIGTEQMSGVSIVNQLIFVFYLCIFGAVSGAGIFTAQYYGQKNDEGVRNTFRVKLILGVIFTTLAIILFLNKGETLIELFLHDGSQEGNLEQTLCFGKSYLYVMLIGLVPTFIETCYSSTLRETGETVVPMRAAASAVFVNLVLNYILIFGKFGMPVLGVAGAATATVISRFIQASIVVIWAHTHADKKTYMKGLFDTFIVPGMVWQKIIVMGMPLLLNETFWAAGVAFQTQCFSVRGLAVVAALNINSTIFNVFNIVFIALGDSVAIIVGQKLGAGEFDEAETTAYRIITFSVMVCMAVGTLLYFLAPLFPQIYNTTDEVKLLAEKIIKVAAITMPMCGFLHSTYFTIRSGGKTIITFIFDSVFLWVVTAPVAYCLAHFTSLPIVTVYLCVVLTDLIKIVIGFVILKSGVWRQNIV